MLHPRRPPARPPGQMPCTETRRREGVGVLGERVLGERVWGCSDKGCGGARIEGVGCSERRCGGARIEGVGVREEPILFLPHRRDDVVDPLMSFLLGT